MAKPIRSKKNGDAEGASSNCRIEFFFVRVHAYICVYVLPRTMDSDNDVRYNRQTVFEQRRKALVGGTTSALKELLLI